MDKLLLKNQTKLVNKLFELGEIEYDDIINYQEDSEGDYPEIYMWILIDNNFKDIFEKLSIPLVEYEGSVWIGQTFCGTSWENSGYWNKLTELLPFLKNE